MKNNIRIHKNSKKQFPYYSIKVTYGDFEPGGKKRKTMKIKEDNLLHAREKAIEYALSIWENYRQKISNGSPTCKKCNEPFQNLDVYSVSVFFHEDKTHVYQIYGSDVDDTMYGLYCEAKFYMHNQIVEGSDISYVCVHKDGADVDFFSSRSYDEEVHNEEDYEEVEVLKFDIEKLLNY